MVVGVVARTVVSVVDVDVLELLDVVDELVVVVGRVVVVVELVVVAAPVTVNPVLAV